MMKNCKFSKGKLVQLDFVFTVIMRVNKEIKWDTPMVKPYSRKTQLNGHNLSEHTLFTSEYYHSVTEQTVCFALQ